jgi:bifunctional UDP-N-acetylglucosamine pyrophosphorylase / glucosamine-1-phosphate N-acetyltransferase
MNIVVLAAGMGKRMKSDLPKVLHTIAGKPLLSHVLDCARSLSPKRLIVIYGHGGEQVQAKMNQSDLLWAKQEPQLGTGHAVLQAVPQLDDSVPTLILSGDVPLIKKASLDKLLAAAGNDKLGVLTVNLANPYGYGRMVRKNGNIVSIVEEKDADAATKQITEINTGILVCPTAALKRWLTNLSNNNAQKEYYLTDIVAKAVTDGIEVTSAQPQFTWEADGINSKVQLAQLERTFQEALALELMDAGVQIIDPRRIDVRGSLTCGRDVFIDINAVFEGNVHLAEGVHIGPNVVIKNASIAKGATIAAFTHIESAEIGSHAKIGPFARLRPGTVLGENTHVGNFVELKNTKMDVDSKANHLAYVGDAIIGKRVNIGAGTITCNYDGANKFTTTIEDDAFIGSDSQLVAPVTVGKGATLGAGTTLSKDAPAGKLTTSRVRQTTHENWVRPVKKVKAA